MQKFQLATTFNKIWWGLIGIILLSLLWISMPYLAGAYYLEQIDADLSNQVAIANLEKTLNFEPGNVQALRQLGRLYLEVGELAKALSVAEQAAKLATHNPLIKLELGDVYDRLGQPAQAITHYEAGLVGDRGPQLTVNYLQQADQRWTAGDEAGAIAIWLDNVRGTGYGDLYANWRLAQYYADDDEAATPYREAVRYFPLESIAPPPDPRLTTFQAQVITGVVEDGLWPRETLLNVVSYRVWQGKTKRTEALLKALTAAHPDDADLRFYLAELYHRRGDWAQAEAAYRQALELDPDYAQAFLRLGEMAEETQNFDVAAEWYNLLVAHQPTDLLGLKKLAQIKQQIGLEQEATAMEERWLAHLADLGPTVVVSQPLSSGWTFIGYRGDEAALVRGETAPLALYWQGEGQPGTATDGWFELGDGQWVQVMEEVRNLVVNGGFELGQVPLGFPRHSVRPGTKVIDTRNNERTQVALLSNQSSSVTEYFPVKQNNFYLQVGWIRSEGGSGYLGRQWRGELEKDARSYSYIAAEVSPDQWTHYAALTTTPLRGAAEVQVWMLNYGEGQVYFDNIMFIDIGPQK